MMHRLRPNAVQERILRFTSLEAGRHVVVIQGNHDNPDTRACNGRSLEVAGLVVGGVGGSLPTGGYFPFELGENEFERILQRLGRVDVLVVHEPPFDTRCDIDHTGKHVGSKAVREYVRRERPWLVLTGHIHESPAVDHLGDTVVFNPGPFFLGNYGEVELEGRRAKARILDVDTGSAVSET